MSRFLPLLCALVFAFAAQAQEAPPAAPAEDLHTIRQLLEQQSKQLEMLTQQVLKLTQTVESRHPETPATPPPAQNMPPAQENNVAMTEPPKGEAVMTPDGSAQHVVAKGETLISIAKHYKISVAELLKVNKIEDERKLQIGQTLSIPAPKPADTPKQKNL